MLSQYIPIEVGNSFSPLSIEDDTDEESSDEIPPLQHTSKTPRRRDKTRKINPVFQIPETLVQPIVHRPYKPSYFLSGKIEGRPMNFLLDTGCNTNIIAKKIFDVLPERVRRQAVVCNQHGVLADGSCLPFHGTLSLAGKVGGIKFEETFVIGTINEDAILGMPFLITNKCQIDFSIPEVRINDKPLPCCDRHGRLLVTKVQTWKDVTIEPRTETNITCRVTTRNHPEMGMVESTNPEIPLASSLNKPGRDGRIIVRCLNPSDVPITIKAGQVVGTFKSVEDDDVCNSDENVEEPRQADNSSDGLTVPAHLEGMFDQAGQGHLEPEQKKQLANLLRRFGDVFSINDEDIGKTDLIKHSIPTVEGAQPFRQAPHRLGPAKEAEAEKQVKMLLEKGMIEPSSGAWSSPVVLVRKKDQSWRFCIDYRRLNTLTVQDAYPLPRIDESLDALSGSKFFSTLDLTSGYWQVPLDKDAREKSAFITRTGLWQWKVLPFGLTSAPATFQRLMERVLQGLHWKTLLLYLVDVIVIAPDFNSHLQRLEEVLKRLRQAGLKLKPKKCELIQKEVKYLGHVVSADGVATDPVKVEAVRQWCAPKNLKEVQAFLGTAGYYRQFIPGYATIAKPLTQLTRKEAPWTWDTAEQESFHTLQEKLITAPVLGYPDPSLTYYLDTDASAVGVGAVLSQVQSEGERVVAYFSKTLSPSERNYCVTRRELLAVVKAVKHFRPYLYGRKFILRTDHASLRWLCRRKEPSAQVARWLETLSEFQLVLEHRARFKHGNADGLSRQVNCIDCKQCKRIEERDGGPSHGDKIMSEEPFNFGNIDRIVTSGRDNSKNMQSDQSSGDHVIARIYSCIRDKKPISDDELHQGSSELRNLYHRKDAMRIRSDGILEIRISLNDRSHWSIVCPPTRRQSLIWETHSMAHAGIGRTTARLLTHWYWPGLTRDVRNIVRSCEKCQTGKTGGITKSSNRQRLHAGRAWQQVAVDLVGPFPVTNKGNRWILVLTDHFTRWQDAIPLPDATAPTVATTLDERVFCYMGLPETIHTDQGVQFESHLMEELCNLWGIEKTRTTPYHPQGNGIVERNNRKLGDSLRTLLLSRGVEEWDTLLPQIMRAFRGTPHSVTGETANFMLLGRELRLPDMLQHFPPDPQTDIRSQYVVDVQDRLREAHQVLREQQQDVRHEDTEEPPLFSPGDMVLLLNKRRRKGENPKLQQKFVGPYEVLKSFPNHTYHISRQGQTSTQNESRLKLYRPCDDSVGQAPATLEPRRGPNMKGGYSRRADIPPCPDSPSEPTQNPPETTEVTNTEVHNPALTTELPYTKTLDNTTIQKEVSSPANKSREGRPGVIPTQLRKEGIPIPRDIVTDSPETCPSAIQISRKLKENRGNSTVTVTTENSNNPSSRPRRITAKPDWYGVNLAQTISEPRTNPGDVTQEHSHQITDKSIQEKRKDSQNSSNSLSISEKIDISTPVSDPPKSTKSIDTSSALLSEDQVLRLHDSLGEDMLDEDLLHPEEEVSILPIQLEVPAVQPDVPTQPDVVDRRRSLERHLMDLRRERQRDVAFDLLRHALRMYDNA